MVKPGILTSRMNAEAVKYRHMVCSNVSSKASRTRSLAKSCKLRNFWNSSIW